MNMAQVTIIWGSRRGRVKTWDKAMRVFHVIMLPPAQRVAVYLGLGVASLFIETFDL